MGSTGFNVTPTGIVGIISRVIQSPTPCFEDTSGTWQSHILNAEDNTIVKSTSTSTNIKHLFININGLESETDYKIVLFLTGPYNADGEAPYAADTSVFISYPFTTPGFGYTPDITLQALTGSAGTLTISFSELFDNPVDIHRYRANGIPDYADSDITLSLQTADASIYTSITSVTGVTVDPGTSGSTDTFIVNADTVTIATGLDNTYNSDIHFDYTITDTSGNTDTGALTIKFVDVISDIVAIPYTFTEGEDRIPPLAPTYRGSITPYFFTALYIPELLEVPKYHSDNDMTSITSAVKDIVLTTTGTGDQSGTLYFTALPFSAGTRLTYIPALGFTGTETFPYTATFGDSTSSSVISFVVSTPSTYTMPVIGDGLDLSAYTSINASCLGEDTAMSDSTGIVGSLGTLVQSPAPCFEDSTHTWQVFILNADDDIVSSTIPSTTSATSNTHYINLNGLEPETDYRIVLFFTGAYSASPADLVANPYVADTTVYRLSSFTTPIQQLVVGDELDLSEYTIIDASCLGPASYNHGPNDIIGGLGTLVQSSAPCFEDNAHTWESFILNADDDTIVYSSGIRSTGFVILFDGLEPETDYRVVLLVTGAYSASPADLTASPYVDDTTVYRIIPITTPGLGYAPDITLQALTGSAGTLTILFSELLGNPVDIHRFSAPLRTTIPDYADSDITLRLQTADASIYTSITSVTGVTVDPGTSGSTDTFIVNADTVTIATGLDNTYNSDIHFDYTVTDGGDISDSGVLTIKFVDVISDITAIPYTFTEGSSNIPSIAPVYRSSIIPYLFTAHYIPELLLDIKYANDDDDASLNSALKDIVLTTTGIGSASGILNFADANPIASSSSFAYMPAPGFTGTETFPYTATFGDSTSSSVISFVVLVPSVGLDLSEYTSINASCLEENTASSRLTGIVGPLGTLSSTVNCFEDNTRTWQAFILNAGDDAIVYSTTPLTTSNLRVTPEFSFDNLDPDTDYRVVLLLTGAYSASPDDLVANPYVADTTVYRIIPFTTLAPPIAAIGDTLDLTIYDAIEESCLESNSFPNLTPTRIVFSLGPLAATECFEDNTRTWQSFILNADDNTVVDFNDPVTTSSTDHLIDFDGLESNTGYRIVLFLTGSYNADGEAPYTADTTVFNSYTFTTPTPIGASLDLSAYTSINASCLGENTANLYAFAIVGSLGSLVQSPEPCFEDNTRTWQVRILNAGDDTIVFSSDFVTTSSIEDTHEIDFTGLEPETDYRSVFFLTGAYSASPDDLVASPYVADTTVFISYPFTTSELDSVDNTMPAIGDELDLSGYTNFNVLCTERITIPVSSTSWVGSLGTLSSTVKCFEDNTRTWQAFILNADDDTIVYSTAPVTTASIMDTHEIDFDGLESETDYKIVLFLTGSYNADGETPYVADTSVFGVYQFTTDESEYAPDITLQALTGSAGTLTISFKELLDNPVDIHRYFAAQADSVPDYADSDITLSLQTADASIYTSITSVTGVTVDPGTSGSTDTFIVNADTVTIDTGLDNTYNSDIHFDYTVTDNIGRTGSGVLTIKFVDVISDIISIPYTFTGGISGIPSIAPVYRSSIIPYLFTALYIPELLLEPEYEDDNDRTSVQFALRDIVLTTTGTGNASGTLSFTDNPGSTATNFVYTPTPGFIGTETFPYTATFGDSTSSSVINFVVSRTVCAASIMSEINFGSLIDGETSNAHRISVFNDGTSDVQLFLKGDNWKSNADGTDIMNVGQTRYSINDDIAYAEREALTSTPTNLLFVLNDNSVAFSLQLLVDLIDDSFVGPSSQKLTLSSVCDDGSGTFLPAE